MPHSNNFTFLSDYSASTPITLEPVEDQLETLQSRGYKERAVLHQFQTVLLRSRGEVMEKVEREREERPIILSLPFDRRLPDAAILQQHYRLLLQRNPEVKDWMPRAPMVAHVRPPSLRDMLVRAKLPPVDRRGGATRDPRSIPQAWSLNRTREKEGS